MNLKFFIRHQKIILSSLILLFGLAYQYLGIQGPSQPVQTSDKLNAMVLTRHAKCRMKCRKIDLSEVSDVYRSGRTNHRKSNPQAKPCPVVSKEKRSSDGQLIRVVMANCPQVLKVITVIDLENKYSCNCP